jgi:hypothetical protein
METPIKSHFHSNTILYSVLNFVFYLCQGTFFISIAHQFSLLKDPQQALGYLLLLAMLPFVLVYFFLGKKITSISVLRQIVILKIVRALVLALMGVAFQLKFNILFTIYLGALFFDLAFNIYGATSARLGKAVAVTGRIQIFEAANMLTTQLGMAAAGILCALFMAQFGLDRLFYTISVLEFVSLIAMLGMKVNEEETDVSLKPVKESQGEPITRSFNRNKVMMCLTVAFAMALPIQQHINLVGAPWLQSLFDDGGKAFGLSTAAFSIGAAAGSLVTMVLPLMKKQLFLWIGPLLTVLSLALISQLRNIPSLASAAFLCGMGIAFTKVQARAQIIEHSNATQINGVMMSTTVLAIVISAFLSSGSLQCHSLHIKSCLGVMRSLFYSDVYNWQRFLG